MSRNGIFTTTRGGAGGKAVKYSKMLDRIGNTGKYKYVARNVCSGIRSWVRFTISGPTIAASTPPASTSEMARAFES